jgi:hypothetical protein
MSDSLAHLYIIIGAKTEEFTKSLKKIEKDMKKTEKVFMSLGKTATAMGGAIVAALAGATKAFTEAGSELNDLSIKTQTSVEFLAGLKYAAEQSGSSLGSMETALRMSSKAIEDAINDEVTFKRKLEETIAAGKKEIDTMIEEGATTEEVTAARKELSDTTDEMISIHKEALNSFNKLGLSLSDLQKLKPEDQFKTILKALAEVESQTERTQIATDLFGRSGADLLPVLADGADGLENMMKKGLELSGWTTDGARQADELGDKWTDVKTSMEKVWGAIGTSLAPSLQDLADKLVAVIGKVADWIKTNPDLVETIGKLGALFLGAGGLLLSLGTAAKMFNDLNSAWQLANKILPGLITQIGGPTTGLAGALGYVGLAIAGIAGWAIASKSIVDNFVNFSKLIEQGPLKTLFLLITKGQLLEYGGAELAPGVQERADLFTESLPSYAAGGIVPGPRGAPIPVIAHGGEEFAGVGNHIGGSTTINITGNFMGNETEARQFARRIKQLIGEDDRRTQFSGVNRGYFAGGSHI